MTLAILIAKPFIARIAALHTGFTSCAGNPNWLETVLGAVRTDRAASECLDSDRILGVLPNPSADQKPPGEATRFNNTSAYLAVYPSNRIFIRDSNMVNASRKPGEPDQRTLCPCESRGGLLPLFSGPGHFAYDNPSFTATELVVSEADGPALMKELYLDRGKMPSGIGGSYRSLAEDVYKSTTVSEEKFNVMESVKKAFNLIGNTRKQGSFIVTQEDGNDKNPIVTNRNRSNMPTSAVPEETALLGTMPSDSMDDIELRNIQLQFPTTRTLSKDDPNIQETTIETDRGTLLVAVQGNRSKPAILTYHDLGLNYVSGFQAFFNYIDMRTLIENFCVYHVNAPGQEPNAATLPEDYIYPTMDELAEQLLFVLGYFGLHKVIGFGVGAGANVLARFSLHHPEKVEALCLINCVSTTAGWIEWGYQKLNTRYLRYKGMTQGVLDYLMWHHFGRGTEERNHDLIQVYKEYFEHHVNPVNLALFIDSYIRRTDLNITRDSTEAQKRKDMSPTLSMAVMNITGSLSPHVDDTVTLNGRLNPTNSSWMKISDCGMVLEEQPGKVSEAFRLFLQGQGYALKLSRSLSTSTSAEAIPRSRNEPKTAGMVRQGSVDVLDCRCKTQKPPKKVIHITENPIADTIAC